MKVSAQNNADRAHLAALIEPTSVAMLTTAADDGSLASRPMMPLEMDRGGALWFFTDLRSAKVEQLRALNLAFSDEKHASYVSLSGHGELHTDRAQIQRLWSPAARPWFPDGPASTNLALLKVVPDSAEYWDGPNTKMERIFAMNTSVLAGNPVGWGVHDRLTAQAKPAHSSVAR